MGYYRVVFLIGYAEIIIGTTTLLTTLGTILLKTSMKPLNVALFVVVAAITSILLGLGILRINKIAYQLLFYFASVIILSKVLIFMDVIQLNGALTAGLFEPLKNGTSIIYHLAVLYFLQQDDIKRLFYDIPF